MSYMRMIADALISCHNNIVDIKGDIEEIKALLGDVARRTDTPTGMMTVGGQIHRPDSNLEGMKHGNAVFDLEQARVEMSFSSHIYAALSAETKEKIEDLLGGMQIENLMSHLETYQKMEELLRQAEKRNLRLEETERRVLEGNKNEISRMVTDECKAIKESMGHQVDDIDRKETRVDKALKRVQKLVKEVEKATAKVDNAVMIHQGAPKQKIQTRRKAS